MKLISKNTTVGKGERREELTLNVETGVPVGEALRVEGIVDLPLPKKEWDRVLDLTRSTLTSFKRSGYRNADSVNECVELMANALSALEVKDDGRAVKLLVEMEVVMAAGAGSNNQVSPNVREDKNPVDYGCRLALDCLKDSAAQCMHGVVKQNAVDLLRARILLEDAAMCVLSAKQRMSET
jgi:hypothetical protein